MFILNINIQIQSLFKARQTTKIRKRYNRVPHLTQDTTWESNKNTKKHITNKSQEVSPFTAGDYKAAINRRERMRNTRHKKHKSTSHTMLSLCLLLWQKSPISSQSVESSHSIILQTKYGPVPSHPLGNCINVLYLKKQFKLHPI